ncbi:hypothetical protein EYF80_029559 [Liparis tanakae]|uniref:Uncharacterized protein n=1 Tax=Liparis tanakae TaxID=230148 RepID=A0A4Z2H5V7_9TELE|nr:hypothetical protein EYF80_029559 [Liparis tanakae]
MKLLAGFPTQRLVARVEHSGQTEPQPLVGLHSQLGDVLQPDGGALPWRQAAHTQGEYIRTLLTLLQQEGLLTGAQSIVVLLAGLNHRGSHFRVETTVATWSLTSSSTSTLFRGTEKHTETHQLKFSTVPRPSEHRH